ncbi:MAG TPA: ParB N-terminal domain-containing protein, partial [Candidatus Competibacteraceae bacterium]|nr:ParB N-terminal domain-containing protein [Candidatus Competibacteraceae bacterium]
AQGLLQPIGVKVRGTKYKLIWGAHRLAAFKELAFEKIPAKVFPENTSDQEALLYELQENYARQELTGAQRREFASKILALGNSADFGNSENFQKNWMDALSEKIGVDRRTIANWWASFTQSVGLELAPRKATEEQRVQFGQWLEERQRQELEEKARKAEEAKAQRLESERQNFLDCLDAAAKEWSYEWVCQQFAEWKASISRLTAKYSTAIND